MSAVLMAGTAGTTMPVFAAESEAEQEDSGFLGSLLGGGGLSSLFSEDGELGKLLSDSELGGLFSEGGELSGLVAEDGPLAGIFAEDGPVANIFAEDGPLANALSEDGPVAQLFAEDGALAGLFGDASSAGDLLNQLADEGSELRSSFDGLVSAFTDENGNLIINQEQAKIVRRVFREFEEGWTPNEIAKHLNEEKINGVKGKPSWNGATIRGMLTNEKYQGDARLQKTYTADYLTKKRVKNEGQVEQYYVEDSHKGIIPKREWEAVQMELARRTDYCKEVGLTSFGMASVESPFTSRLVSARCGAVFGRKSWKSRSQYYWMCRNKEAKHGNSCQAENINDDTLHKVFIIAWNSIVKDRDKKLPSWESMKEAGNPLQVMRAQQMIELTEQGPLICSVSELTRMVLERIIIHSKTHFTVRFLDGTSKEVCIS